MRFLYHGLYPLRKSLNENEVNSWKNLVIEINRRGLDLTDFWETMNCTKPNGTLDGLAVSGNRTQIMAALAGARTGNFDFLEAQKTS